MKPQEFAVVGGVGFITVILSIMLCTLLLSPKRYVQNIEKVDPVSSNFTIPSAKYFNDESINPTQNITVNPNTNEQPFSSSAQ